MGKAYGEKPIWITEIGWNTDVPGISEEMKANYLVRVFNISFSLPNIKKIFIYSLKDSGNGFGLLDSSWNEKPLL